MLERLLLKLMRMLFARGEGKSFLYRDFYCAIKRKGERQRKELSARERKILRNAEEIIYNLSQSPNQKCVYIFQKSFFDRLGLHCFAGGAERYSQDLADIINSLGYQTILIQEADQEVWHKKYNGLDVLGLPSYRALASRLPSPKIAIYSGISDFRNYVKSKKLMISHGVTWDKPNKTRDVEFVRRAVIDFDKIVSVDTNTISCLRTEFGREIGANDCRKFEYIPNYVDKNIFYPSVELKKNNIKILFPRRLCVERGGLIFIDAVSEILKVYDSVNVLLVGFIHDQENERRLKNLMLSFPGRVNHLILKPHEMPSVYRDADITVIPTLYSEGTSLSCIEAMASGNAVIASYVGGLPNLIINGYNGLLISPTLEDIVDSISSLLNDANLRKELSSNALDVSTVFNKERWRESWVKVLDLMLGE